MNMRQLITSLTTSAIGLLAVGTVITTAAFLTAPSSPSRPNANSTFTHGLSVKPDSYLGVFERTSPASYKGVSQFGRSTGTAPNIALYYSGWYEKFQSKFAAEAYSHGAIPFVEIEPRGASLAGIADGGYDRYLESYAKQVSAFGHPVILSFGHEMNAPWYPWGHTHASPAVFVAAWRHIVSLFRESNAFNVTWLWAVNCMCQQGTSVSEWWPGSRYVTWVGIDGYYYSHFDRFATVFAPTVKAIRRFTSDPVLISEAAVDPAAGQVQGILNLLNGAHEEGELGVVWFDVGQRRSGAPYEDWRLEDRPSALSAFHRSVEKYLPDRTLRQPNRTRSRNTNGGLPG